VNANGLSSDFAQIESLREGGRRQIVQTRLGALPVIKDLDVFRDFFLRRIASHELAMIDEFIFSEPQKDSIGALSKQFPRRLIEGSL